MARKKKIKTFTEITPQENEKIILLEEQEEELSIAEISDKIDNAKLVEDLINQLPENYKSIMVLHYEEDMTFEDIAKIMERPENTIRSWHRRAIIILKEKQKKPVD